MVQRAKHRMTVLFVDDDDTTRESMADLLEEEGYAVTIAADAASALELFETIRPSVVVTDFEMPGLRGDALTRQILLRSPATPVILVSGSQTRDTNRLAAAAGATHFLSKPLDVVGFLELLERYR